MRLNCFVLDIVRCKLDFSVSVYMDLNLKYKTVCIN